MNSNSQLDEIEKAFYSDGYQFGINATEKGLVKSTIHDGLQKMHSAIDNLIESLSEFAEQQGHSVACKKGCEWCCHQPVFALDYELDYLSFFLSKHFSKEEQKKIKRKAKEKNSKLMKLENDLLLNAKYPCPLLDNGSCMAYIARPMACRIYLSSDVKTCLKFYHSPEDKNNYPALLEFPMRAGRMMNEGFKAALKTSGLLAKEFRIEERLC